MATVLALDPSLSHTGWAVIELKDGRWQLVGCGCVHTKANKEARYVAFDDVDRCASMYRELRTVISVSKADLMLAEIPTGGSKSALAGKSMASSKAVLASLVEETKVPMLWCIPSETYKALKINKKSKTAKKQVAAKVRKMFDLQRLTGLVKNDEHILDAMGAFLGKMDSDQVRNLLKMPATTVHYSYDSHSTLSVWDSVTVSQEKSSKG